MQPNHDAEANCDDVKNKKRRLKKEETYAKNKLKTIGEKLKNPQKQNARRLRISKRGLKELLDVGYPSLYVFCL